MCFCSKQYLLTKRSYCIEIAFVGMHCHPTPLASKGNRVSVPFTTRFVSMQVPIVVCLFLSFLVSLSLLSESFHFYVCLESFVSNCRIGLTIIANETDIGDRF